MSTRRPDTSPSPELVRLVQEVYPLVAGRHRSRVASLALAHGLLTLYAQRMGHHDEDWPDMALRVMLEYEREGTP